MDDNVVGIECRFAYLCPIYTKNGDELHLIKEQVHYKDGSIKPNVRLLKNYKRDFYITKKHYQNHQDKKEWEEIAKLDKYTTRQSNMVNTIARTLGYHNPKVMYRQLANSPYLYGSDISSTALIKHQYKTKFPDLQTFYSYCSLDIESSMDTREIILITICFNNNVFTSIYKPFIDGIMDFDEVLKEKTNFYLKDHINVSDYKFDYEIHNSQIKVIKSVFDKLHEWKPDFLSIWNMDYDINEITKTLINNGIDPKDIFSDPSVPTECRYYRYKQGKLKKVTSAGKESPIPPSNQWHTVFAPSSFYVIDAMCTYRRNRLMQPELENYSLDFVLNKELGLRKLKFKEADDYSGGEWHELMQSEYPVEYIVYNIFDSISMIELERKTKDLAVSLPLFSGSSDFMDYESQPKRLADKFHFLCLEKGLVIGTTGKEMKNELDDKTLSLKGWIVNLPAHLITNDGLCNIKEDPTLHTNIRIHCHDLDIAGAYPSSQVCANVSKETTKSEIVSISQIDPYVSRMENLNLTNGPTNALEYCQSMFNFPSLPELLDSFLKET